MSAKQHVDRGGDPISGERPERDGRAPGDLGGAGLGVGGRPFDPCPGVVHPVIVGGMPSTRPGPSSLTDELLRGAERPTLLVSGAVADPASVALLSGSFDPLTVAHAALAEAASDRADLVLLVYSVRTLPKEGPAPPPLLSEGDRLRSLEAFARDRPKVLPSLASHGLLAEQAEAARVRFPAARLFLVMGSDKALQLLDPKWYAGRDEVLGRLFGHAEVMYADRSGQEGAVGRALARPENVAWRSRFERLALRPEIAAVASREVRERLARGEDVTWLVPAEVHRFIGRAT
jgi:nicotinic acid mononucleotide adenylyltransferase